MTWLSEICDVLRSTHAEQIKGDTVKFEYGDNLTIKKPIGYCALGLLKCNKKPVITWDDYHDSKHYDATLKSYGVPFEFLEGWDLPYLEYHYEGRGANIYNLIIDCNDFFGLSFPEIADFLETTFEDAV